MSNIQQPRFAAAGNSDGADGDAPSWLLDSGDPLDVDVLADYLLEDGGGDDGHGGAPSGFDFGYVSLISDLVGWGIWLI